MISANMLCDVSFLIILFLNWKLVKKKKKKTLSASLIVVSFSHLVKRYFIAVAFILGLILVQVTFYMQIAKEGSVHIHLYSCAHNNTRVFKKVKAQDP